MYEFQTKKDFLIRIGNVYHVVLYCMYDVCVFINGNRELDAHQHTAHNKVDESSFIDRVDLSNI